LPPKRRTLDRGPDPDDNSYSITVILPDVPLCDTHTRELLQDDVRLGWCDDPQCRNYGEAGEASTCGAPYMDLAPKRSRSTAKNLR
jgi:hypothetical protein